MKPRGENQILRAETGKETEGGEKLVNFVKFLARESREKDGVPLQDDGRIDMDAFASVHPDLGADKERVREWFAEWHGNVSQNTVLEERLKRDGEKLELLSYAIFCKNLGKDFIVVRSSFHDDRTNKVDALLLERSTGNLVCAFDEVGAISGATFEEKQKAIQDHNLHNQGARLKYGLHLEEKDGAKQLAMGEVENVPLFYVALPRDHIKKGVAEFIPSLDQQSEFEKKLFEYFIAAIDLQIQGLGLYSGRLNEGLKGRLQTFHDVIKKIRRRRIG